MKKYLIFAIFMVACALTQVSAQDTLKFQGHRPWNWKCIDLPNDVLLHIIGNSSEVQTDDEFQQVVAGLPFRTEAEFEPVFWALKTSDADKATFGVTYLLMNVKADKAFIYLRVNDRWYRCTTEISEYKDLYYSD